SVFLFSVNFKSISKLYNQSPSSSIVGTNHFCKAFVRLTQTSAISLSVCGSVVFHIFKGSPSSKYRDCK
ncbi:hypothetical protein FRX31_021418, partial [Thalictrum thalictroides]